MDPDRDSLVERIEAWARQGADADEVAAVLAQEAGSRPPLERARRQLQARVRRDTDDQVALKGIRMVSRALALVPRDARYTRFNDRPSFF